MAGNSIFLNLILSVQYTTGHSSVTSYTKNSLHQVYCKLKMETFVQRGYFFMLQQANRLKHDRANDIGENNSIISRAINLRGWLKIDSEPMINEQSISLVIIYSLSTGI